jgi:hypothetical protein
MTAEGNESIEVLDEISRGRLLEHGAGEARSLVAKTSRKPSAGSAEGVSQLCRSDLSTDWRGGRPER